MQRRAVFALVAGFFCLVCSVAWAQSGEAEKRIALVIGNAAYQAGALTTPANDAGLVAQTLQAAGFDVVGARDLDTNTLRSSLREFIDKASASGPNTVAMVYFAGTGVQFEGENYLVPVDAKIARDSDVPLEAVRLTDLMKPLAALQLKARLIVLDAARANSFAGSGQPLAGGLALMQPDPGTLIAFNAAPGTIAPESRTAYSAYATALSEAIKEGGLSLDALFDHVRLRVAALTAGAELTWEASRVEAPFVFFERTSAAPAQPDHLAELRARPIRELGSHDAYVAALARDRLSDYGDFLSAYPKDPLAKRVRVIVAARREAITWHETATADRPNAYWTYLRRYPRGPHCFDARRRLHHFAVALEPPPGFDEITYDVPPPPEDEIVYVEHPVVYLADPIYDLPPAPPIPVVYLPPPIEEEDLELPPPAPPVADYVLPVPIFYPVPAWVERPAYVDPPPVNVINVNIHNTVRIDPANETVVVTNRSGQTVDPIPAALLARPPSPSAAQGGGLATAIAAHPAASAAIAAAAVALPAAVAVHGRQQNKAGAAPAQPAPSISAPRPSPAAQNQLLLRQSGPPTVAPPGAAPRAAPAGAPIPAVGQTPVNQPGSPAITPVRGAQPLPTPSSTTSPGRQAAPLSVAAPAHPMNGSQPAIGPAHRAGPSPLPNAPAAPNQPLASPGMRNEPAPGLVAAPTHPASPAAQVTKPFLTPQPAAQQAAQRQAEQAAARERAQQAAQQQAQQAAQRAQQAAQQRAQQAAQQRAQQAAQQQAQQAAQRAQQAAQQRAQQAAQRAQQAAQQRAQQAAQQQAQQAAQRAQQAAQQRAQQAAQQRAMEQRRSACGHPGTPPCR